MNETDGAPTVVVVGAGPTGLTLAAELAAAGIRCRVLDKRPRRVEWSRAIGLEPRTLELFDLRGMAGAFVERGLPWRMQPLGDRRGFLDYGRLDTPFPYVLILEQGRTEDVLREYAVKAGAEIVRGAELVGLAQDSSGVTIEVHGRDGTWTERSDYLIGCDGVHSDVRTLSGIGFSGRSYRESLIVADVRLSAPPTPPVDARITRRGMVAVFPLHDGIFRLVILDHERMRIPADRPVTEEELRESVVSIFRDDLGVHEPVWMSRFRSEQRQAERYRAGRVFLAGDAAHTHLPSGGQGLQMGIHDAMNLGWKLAAEALGRAPAGLLDSYQRERSPIAASMLRKTDVAFRFETSDLLTGRIARGLSTRLMHVGRLQPPVLRQFAGLALRYPRRRGEHRLVGRRLPDAELPGGSRLFSAFRERAFVLLDQTGDGVPTSVARPWASRVTPVRGRIRGRRLPAAVLVRPDGHVAWAGSGDRREELASALHAWCGPVDR